MTRRVDGQVHGWDGAGVSASAPVSILADGTIKQTDPLSGTRVWTVPGRGGRPLVAAGSQARAAGPVGGDRPCAFCPERAQEVPPEKARVVHTKHGWETSQRPTSSVLAEAAAEFRRVSNLFAIVSYDYWRANHDLAPAPAAVAQHDAWLATDRGREPVERVLRARFLAAGGGESAWAEQSQEQRLTGAMGLFAGGHDVIIARRHVTDGPAPQLVGSGTLTHQEHAAYVRFTVDAMADLYTDIPAATYVAAFQNWLAPAGASFDHLHKQVVAIDEHGAQIERESARLAADERLYAHHLAYAREQGLVVAENEHAVAFAGFGHRYPTFEIYAKDPERRPFDLAEEQVDGMSDVLHALHVATGVDIPCNEEWHHRPIDVDTPMPWRIQLKWRVSTLAGFEGSTRIHITTISPWELRDRALTALHDVPDGVLAPGLVLGRGEGSSVRGMR